MTAGAVRLEEHPRGVILPVRAHAGARKNGLAGTHDGMLRVAVTAAPEKGKANKAIVAQLSKSFAVPKSSIELLLGDTSAQKRFLFVGCDAERIRKVIAAHA